MSNVGPLTCARVLALLLFSSSAAAAAPLPIAGLWETNDGKAVVRIDRCGARVCGWIARVLDATPGIPKTDVNNPDPGARNRPIAGLAILSGFHSAARGWNGGKAYDPKIGRSYNSWLALAADGSLEVTGCVVFLCKSVRWTRYG